MPAVAGRNFSNGDLAIGGGLIVALIATFLPWYSASANGGIAGYNFSVSINALSYWAGWLFFLALLVGIALFVVRHFVPTVQVPDLPQPDAIIYLAIGAFMVVMAILFLLLGSGTTVSGPGYSAGPSFGLFLGLIAAVAVAAGGFLKRSEPAQAGVASSSSGAGSSFGGGTPTSTGSGSTLGGGTPTAPGAGSGYGGGAPTPPATGSTYGGGTPTPPPTAP